MKNKILKILILVLIPICVNSEIIKEFIIQGNERVTEEMILYNTGITLPIEYSDYISREIIEKLYSTELFNDISIEKINIGNDSCAFLIKVVENPSLETLILNGVHSLNKNDIRDWLRRGSTDTTVIMNWADAPIKGAIITQRKLLVWENFILNIYRKNGFIGTKVDIQVQEIGVSYDSLDYTAYDDWISTTTYGVELAVIINIYEGRRSIISDVEFHGNYNFSNSDLKEQLKNKEWGFYSWSGLTKIFRFGFFRKGMFNQLVFENEDVNSIQHYYQSNGFPDAKVDSFNYVFDSDSSLIKIKVFVTENEKKLFGETTYEGNNFFLSFILSKYISYKMGDEFNIELIEKTMANFGELYADSAMINSSFTPSQIERDSFIDIKWIIVEGPRFKIRRIEIVGNYKTKDNVIRREITLLPGEYFSLSDLRLSGQKIFNLGFFENAEPSFNAVPEDEAEFITDGELDSNTAYLDIIIQVVEKKSGEIKGGLTMSQMGGIGAYVKFAVPNLMGRGEILDIQFDINSSMWNANVGYTEPWVFGSPWSAGLRVYATTYNMDYYKYRKLGSKINLYRPFLDIEFLRLYTSYTIERVDVEIIDKDNTSDYLRSQEGIKYLSKVGLTLVRDSRNKYFNTERGSMFSLSTNLCGGFLQGDVNYREHLFEAREYFPLYINSFNSKMPTSVLSFRLKTGVISDVYSMEGTEVPIYDRYRLGGIGEWGIRGYDDLSIGPVDEGEIIGGCTALLFNTEFSFHLGEMANISLFADIGNSWNDPYSLGENFSLNDLYKGAGIGFRINMPMIGIIGVDYAYGFSTGEWIPHIQFGGAF